MTSILAAQRGEQPLTMKRTRVWPESIVRRSTDLGQPTYPGNGCTDTFEAITVNEDVTRSDTESG
jgi:hypothetical protein